MIAEWEEYWTLYGTIVGYLLRPLEWGAGDSADRMATAEESLGVELPGLLRQHYLRTSNRPDINKTHNRLLNLDDLFIAKSVLVFYEENERVCSWGIELDKLGSADPPVVQGQYSEDDDDWAWFPEMLTLSEFLLVQLFTQCAMGAMPFSASYVAGDEVVQALHDAPEGWLAFVGKESTEISALYSVGKLLFVVSDRSSVEATACGRTPEDLAAVEDVYGLTEVKTDIGVGDIAVEDADVGNYKMDELPDNVAQRLQQLLQRQR
jgi:hypothetical protein